MGLVLFSICVVMVCAWRVVSSSEDIVTTEVTLPFLGGNSLTVPERRPVKKGIGAGFRSLLPLEADREAKGPEPECPKAE